MNAIWCYCNVLHVWMWATHVNTDLKCWLSMLALVRLSDRSNGSVVAVFQIGPFFNQSKFD